MPEHFGRRLDAGALAKASAMSGSVSVGVGVGREVTARATDVRSSGGDLECGE